MRTRFAPSPTGHLHLGHAYAAGFAQTLAQSQGGECLLRFEDIDKTRVRPEYYDSIIDDLSFLGLTFPLPHLSQQTRFTAYQEALQQLIHKGFVYPCFCSRKDIQKELATLTNAPHGPEGELYPGTCRNLTEKEVADRLASGAIPAWRLHSQRIAEHYPRLHFQDSFAGPVQVNPALLGDIILARKDIGTSYHIAVVVDDAHQQITDVTRGNDLIHATHVHRLLQKALDLPEPHYHHHPLIEDHQGNRLAKRNDSLSIKALRDRGKSKQDIWRELHLKSLEI